MMYLHGTYRTGTLLNHDVVLVPVCICTYFHFVVIGGHFRGRAKHSVRRPLQISAVPVTVRQAREAEKVILIFVISP
jgi:hypothetical protein